MPILINYGSFELVPILILINSHFQQTNYNCNLLFKMSVRPIPGHTHTCRLTAHRQH